MVPAPQAQTSSSSPSSTPGDATASSPPQSPQDNIHLPPPPLPGHSAAYQTVKQKGSTGAEENNLAILGGRPRSVEGFPAELRGARRRRHDEPHEFEDDDSVSVRELFVSLFFVLELISANKFKLKIQRDTFLLLCQCVCKLIIFSQFTGNAVSSRIHYQ